MALHPQIAALSAQLENLASFLRANGERLWSSRIDLCRHLVADSNFVGVERFLRLFEGDENLKDLVLPDPLADRRLSEMRKASWTMADRLDREEREVD